MYLEISFKSKGFKSKPIGILTLDNFLLSTQSFIQRRVYIEEIIIMYRRISRHIGEFAKVKSVLKM